MPSPLPGLATSGIGSLPHTQLELALQQAFAVDVPFLPQLPATNPAELMIPQALEGLPGLSSDDTGESRVDLAKWQRGSRDLAVRLERAIAGQELSYFEPTPLTCRAWKPFLWDVQEKRRPWAKAQVTGPMTLRFVLRLEDGRPLSAAPEVEAQVLKLALARALAMARAVKETGAHPVIFLDEPGLYAFDRKNPQHLIALQELRIVLLALRKEGATVGIHCCSNTDWATLLGLDIDLLSIDARLSLGAVLSQRPAFEAFLAAGKRLSIGIIPTNLDATYDVGELVGGMLDTLHTHLGKPELVDRVVSSALLTPACGLALRTVSDAERVFTELDAARELLRGKLGVRS